MFNYSITSAFWKPLSAKKPFAFEVKKTQERAFKYFAIKEIRLLLVTGNELALCFGRQNSSRSAILMGSPPVSCLAEHAIVVVAGLVQGEFARGENAHRSGEGTDEESPLVAEVNPQESAD